MKRGHNTMRTHLRSGAGLFARSLVGAGIAVWPAACTVGPEYQVPKRETAAQWSGLQEQGTAMWVTGEAAETAAWWRALNDPMLDELVQRAVAGNNDLRLAEARIREARAMRGVTAADWSPQVDAVGSAERRRRSENANTQTNGPVNGQTHSLYQVGFDARWELDVFGGTKRAVEAADAEIARAEEDRRATLVTLLAEVGRNYVELRSVQERIAIAEKNIAAQRDALDLSMMRFKAGLVSELDSAQAENLLTTTQATVPALQVQVRSAMHRLATLLGQEPGALNAELDTASGTAASPVSIPAGIPSDLLRRRPDIRAAERGIAAATARIGVATADLYPKFTLTGGVGLQSSSTGSLLDASSRYWSIGPGVVWPMLEGGRIRANIAVQDAREEQALITYENTVLGALEETENAISAFSREHDRRSALAQARDAAQKAVDLATVQYRSGLTAFLTVLDAQRSLYAAEDALVQSDAVVRLQAIALYKALGGAWEVFEAGR